MTYDEVKNVPFHFVSHLSMENEHQSVYADDSGRLGFCDITERISEFETGKVHREYRIDNKWYKTKKAFEKAMEAFEYKKGDQQ